MYYILYALIVQLDIIMPLEGGSSCEGCGGCGGCEECGTCKWCGIRPVTQFVINTTTDPKPQYMLLLLSELQYLLMHLTNAICIGVEQGKRLSETNFLVVPLSYLLKELMEQSISVDHIFDGIPVEDVNFDMFVANVKALAHLIDLLSGEQSQSFTTLLKTISDEQMLQVTDDSDEEDSDEEDSDDKDKQPLQRTSASNTPWYIQRAQKALEEVQRQCA